jgi:carbon monoxide dehydrogenase subunit G
MTVRVHVSIDLPAPQEVVWADLSDVASHAEWMSDAESITFVGPQRSEVGTVFDCVTRVGPIRLTDRMTVTAWDAPWRIAIRHDGIVTGSGQFTLAALSGGRTRFRWDESLTLPWWLGGRLGGPLAAYVLGRIWRANLARFARRFTTGPESAPP